MSDSESHPSLLPPHSPIRSYHSPPPSFSHDPLTPNTSYDPLSSARLSRQQPTAQTTTKSPLRIMSHPSQMAHTNIIESSSNQTVLPHDGGQGGIIHHSPQEIHSSLPPGRSSENIESPEGRKRRRAGVTGESQKDEGGRRTVTLGLPEKSGQISKLSPKRSTSNVHHGGNIPMLTSCEACRKGKRRCEPSPLVPPDHPDAAKLPCARCRRFALECHRVRVTRRKGPAPVDLSALSDAAYGFQNGSGSGSSDFQPSTEIYPRPPLPLEQLRRATVVQVHDPAMSGMQQDYPLPPTGPGGYATSPSFPLLVASPTVSTSTFPDNLDQVVAGPVIDNIINLFFDYVYPLTPCLHRPTFVANLTARMDKTDPVFFALTLTVIASTLVQVPRSLVNLEKTEIESLARRCVRVAKAKISFIWEEPVPVQSSFVVISYLEGIVHLLLGNNTAHVVATAQANQLALAMRLNEESSYEGLDPIESEIRRRAYWLLFQADKSTACLRARTICLRLDDAPGLALPTEVDDEQITSTGITPQPVGRIPLIAGFNIVTSLFK
ncbi:hypothetical protein M231_03199 [Tremella mesenterica]|uniref:Zn(2)-C6 fungal-type domain-containing protein n=1 Tax=Tremella mesenterica TaxID=5217 RepID=A0A4Q1BP20_TREME|nr:hypothetical protein M231_03199 [Tremella mesenterica]